MLNIRLPICALLLFGIAEAESSMLFEDDIAMSVTITAPMRDLISRRHKKEEFPAVLQFNNGAGQSVELNIRVAARGIRDWMPAIFTFAPDHRQGKCSWNCVRGPAQDKNGDAVSG